MIPEADEVSSLRALMVPPSLGGSIAGVFFADYATGHFFSILSDVNPRNDEMLDIAKLIGTVHVYTF